ncbi:MAG TPA: hypothetical protein VFW14_10945 [Gaiellales bacterium]|jgi:hypothetical protein|nr:hypothetical protein [Gaiellales bacterium]
MPKVRMQISGRAVGSSDEQAGFAELVRTRVGGVTDRAFPDVRFGSEDAVTIEIVLDREFQSDVGEAIEPLLAEPQITSAVLDEKGDEV